MKHAAKYLLIVMAMSPLTVLQASNAVQELQDKYQKQGATVADLQQAQSLWSKRNGDRACTSCHGSDLSSMGKHRKTGKIIQPMAKTVNKERYLKPKKIEKWFLRNCKWTFGRECTSQEKMNLISWLNSQ